MWLERALPHTEDVCLLAADNLSDQFAAMPGLPNDLLDGHALLDHGEDRCVGFLAPEIAFILDPLGRSQKLGIDHRCPDDGTDLTHGFAHRVEESAACILHEMPAIGDLGGVR